MEHATPTEFSLPDFSPEVQPLGTSSTQVQTPPGPSCQEELQGPQNHGTKRGFDHTSRAGLCPQGGESSGSSSSLRPPTGWGPSGETSSRCWGSTPVQATARPEQTEQEGSTASEVWKLDDILSCFGSPNHHTPLPSGLVWRPYRRMCHWRVEEAVPDEDELA